MTTVQEVRDFAEANPVAFNDVVCELGFAISNNDFAKICERKYAETLRDKFAMAALTGLLSNMEAAHSDGWSWRTGTLIGDAFMFADEAMERAR